MANAEHGEQHGGFIEGGLTLARRLAFWTAAVGLLAASYPAAIIGGISYIASDMLGDWMAERRNAHSAHAGAH